MSTSYKILFPIETTARELLYKLVLSAKLAERGHECYVGSKQEIERMFQMVKPFLYFDKGYHPLVSDAIHERVRKQGGLIVNLDEEGGVDFKHSSTIVSRYPETAFEAFDLIFLWGESQYNVLKEKRVNFRNEKIVVSGHPRFELLKPSFHKLYDNEVQSLQKRLGKFILFNTNMGFGNNIRGDEFVRENYGGRIKNLKKVMESDRDKVKNFISLIMKLAPMTDRFIVLRPHPEESHAVYNDAFKSLKNVRVIYEGSAVTWIIASEVMIHPDCTTGIEALMVGKKPVSYLPTFDESIHTFIPVKLSNHFVDEEELIRFILSEEYLTMDRNGTDTLLQQFFSFDKSSSELITAEVDRLLCHTSMQRRRDLSKYYSMKSRVEHIVKSFYRKASKGEAYALYENKLKGFEPKSVRSTFNAVKSVWRVDDRIAVRKVNPFLYKICR